MMRLKVLFLFLITLALNSCSDQIDETNMFISTKSSMIDYLKANENYSDFVALLEKVRLSNNENASSLANVLSARGNYTCFAPNNLALREFLELPLDKPIDLYEMNDSVAAQITKSCIIDNGDKAAYTQAVFPISGAFDKTNLNDRVLMVLLDSLTNKYLINTTSYVEKADIEVSNGILHLVDKVISPSTKSIPLLIEKSSNMHIMSKLLKLTSWEDSLMKFRDDFYEEIDKPEKGGGLYNGTFVIPKHRYLGFTAFVETDDVFVREWGIDTPIINEETGEITNWDLILNQLEKKCAETYVGTSDDLKNEDNAVNQFVSYHFIKGAYAYNNFVWHYCEYGYQWGDKTNPQQKNLSVDLSAYYTTLGKQRRMLKITHVADEANHPMYINRKTVYDNHPLSDYKAKEVIDGSQNSNVYLYENNGNEDNNSVNGFIFPINRVLLYDDFVKNYVFNERMRIDICYFLHELASNKQRNTGSWNFLNDYFENIINVNAETEINYICHALYGTGPWRDYEGDEFLFLGVFDFTMRLPSVPKAGTYELRMGCSNNANRGMAQIYFGENPNALVATGLPIDLRQGGNSNNPNIPWVADGNDEETNRENDKNLRNQGYMKGPKFFTFCNGLGTNPVRNSNYCLRYIVTQQHMIPGKTYYIRFKSALEKTDAQFFVDYFELVPKSIYANEANPEDIW